MSQLRDLFAEPYRAQEVTKVWLALCVSARAAPSVTILVRLSR